MERIIIEESGLNLVIEITPEREIKLLHLSALPFEERLVPPERRSGFRLAEVKLSGENCPLERHGGRYAPSAPGCRLRYHSHRDFRNGQGRKLEIVTVDEETGLEATSHLQCYDGIAAVRSWTGLVNKGGRDLGVEYVSSFCLSGLDKEGLRPADEKLRLSVPHNAWQRELQWQSYSLPQLGLSTAQPYQKRQSSSVVGFSNTGNWSTKQYIPMGYLENTETGSGLMWQIEHNGSWHWEIEDLEGYDCLLLSGPAELQNHWWKRLRPGGAFVSVPACVVVTARGFDDGVGQLTRYRRAIRRSNKDNETLGVIFNDYMNCLWADPTTEKEIPLIDAARAAGCEYYCIDAGWYHPGYWWDNVGEWLPAGERFPDGLPALLSYIRSKGMIPGLWLEIEVMGINCPKLAKTKPEWFFQRHGEPVRERSRYQLDFRSPEVIAHADEVIGRLVGEYGVGYIKMDYNIEPDMGTEHDSDSFGDGLLEHNRAYLGWLDRVFRRYPELIIENCSSGGMRMDYAMLSRHSIQSTSDQEDYLRYATIAANSPSALCPEQSAIWSYPLADGDGEEVAFNMVNAMLLRIHQSGHLVNLSPERRELVHQGIACYKAIRQDIRAALPFWPLGLSRFSDSWVSLGLRTEQRTLLAVWRRGGDDCCILPVEHLKGRAAEAVCLYPEGREIDLRWNQEKGTLSVRLPRENTARLLELIHREP